MANIYSDRLIYSLSLLVWVLLSVWCLSCSEKEQNLYNLEVNDPGLELELVAREPSIMTPIGLTIDEDDALYILESHTHNPPEEYEGSKFDLIKKSVDTNHDGIPEKWVIFADSIEDGMNLLYGHDYGLFVSTKNSVSLYMDRDGDGKSENKKTLIKMVKPTSVYDHAGILGIALSADGWLYVSRGNTGSNYWLVEGTDGSTLTGYGDGGNVMRCRTDGSRLEEVATGFWNPFDIKFDKKGRLFVTDNDPDSRGPNRLIEIVPGGDYGYKSLYGGSGVHPYLSWNAELPGTLPYAAPLGEAPCAMIDAGFTNFGPDYESHVLVNIWEENNIVRIRLEPDGSSVKGEPEVMVQGDSLFHPVALATNSRGDLYITDWVLRQYPNHGHGRIWRLKSKTNQSKTIKSQPVSVNRFKVDTRDVEQLIQSLSINDPFEQSISRYYLARKADYKLLVNMLKNEDPQIRLQSLLTFFRREEKLEIEDLKPLLLDQDPDIRRMALIYTGSKTISDMESDLLAALRKGLIGADLFETFLATLRHLQPEFIQAFNTKSVKSSKIPRKLPEFFIEKILKDPSIDEQVKAIALPYLDQLKENKEFLTNRLKNAESEALQIALIKACEKIPNIDPGNTFKAIAVNKKFTDKTRSNAVAALSSATEKYCRDILPLIQEESTLLRYAAIRYLCACTEEGPVRSEVDNWLANHDGEVSKTVVAAWDACNGNATRPSSDDHWVRLIDDTGDPDRGRLVFESGKTLCSNCHEIDGWGGKFGPELSKIGSSKSKLQLANAILDPSAEIAPEWQGWYIVDKEGKRHTGRQIDVHLNYVELLNSEGNFDSYASPRSYGVIENSLMPDGLENTMTAAEFNDLIAYMKSLK